MNASALFLSAAVALGAEPAPPAAPAPVVAAPAAIVAAPAPITVTGTGCNGCGAPAVSYAAPVSVCDPCAPRVGLFDRLRANWAARPRLLGNRGCAPVPVCAPAPAVVHHVASAPAACGCGQPVFTGFTTSCSDPCERVGLLARLRAKFGGGRSCDAVAAPLAGCSTASSIASIPAVSGCTSIYGTVLTPPVAGAPVVGAPVTTLPDSVPPAPAPMPMTEPKKEQPKKEEPKKEEPKKELSVQVPSLTVPSVEVPRVPTLGGTSGKY
ncbi:MAG: hypothetical protein MUF18_09870 [Fimbriiglobus sp.]|nr:hypothetical protein [Fimbriiglobus sp.]